MTTALLSVSDKTGIVEFAQALHARGIRLLSTGGTARLLAQNDLPVTEVSEITGFPEMLDGRVKTLHPRVHGGLLADLNDAHQVEHMQKQGMVAFDLLAVNLYPFEQTVAGGGSLEECRRQIDIGGVAMLRAGAKNFGRLAVLTRPQDYPEVLQEMAGAGTLGAATCLKLARIAFQQVLAYDQAISQYFDALEEVPC